MLNLQSSLKVSQLPLSFMEEQADIFLINGDSSRLPLPSQIFHSLISSPPYYKQRRYRVITSFPEFVYTPEIGMPEIRVPAWSGELGWEPVPEWFIGHLVFVAREAFRVLRDDGTWWLNMGDSYWNEARRRDVRQIRENWRGEESGQLMRIPYRLMAALQADGWICRNDIFWHKPNPLPNGQLHGSEYHLQDDGLTRKGGNWRHTRSHELVIQLTKQPNHYYADSQLVADPPKNYLKKGGGSLTKSALQGATSNGTGKSSLRKMSVSGANPKSVLNHAPEGGNGNHNALFPESLVRDLMRVSTPKHVCPTCQSPWLPVIQKLRHRDGAVEKIVRDYSPACSCDNPSNSTQPGIVGDLFAGTGTVASVARKYNYRCVVVELSLSNLIHEAAQRLR